MAMEKQKSIAVFPHIHAKQWKKMASRQDKEGISAWQLTFIGIASILGAGYFLATASTIHETGVSVLLSYAIGILVVWTIFATFGEMLAREPGHKGSALSYIEKYLGRAYGFIGSWLYWLAGILIMSSEVTGISIFT